MKKDLLKITIFVFLFAVIGFPPSVAVADESIKILIVPGHDDVSWGAQYKDVKEADMNLRLGTELFKILKKDKRFEVYITRDSDGYTLPFTEYFADNQEEIISFREGAKLSMKEKVAKGFFIQKENVPHNDANEYASVILYGINKWANENEMDTVIHIHFNDYPRLEKWKAGKYRGFAVYMPEEQMANSQESDGLARSVFKQLKRKYHISTYPKEKEGLLPDQSLIALGANGTLYPEVRSLLVEYGYIYRFANTSVRHKTYKDMATLSATGIKNYFFKK